MSDEEVKPVLILDLDHMLAHVRVAEGFGAVYLNEIAKHRKKFKEESEEYDEYGYKSKYFFTKRPFLDEFLSLVSPFYTVVLFTTATEEYADRVLEVMKIRRHFHFVFHGEDCLHIKHGAKIIRKKDLSVVAQQFKVPVSRCVLIEDRRDSVVAEQKQNVLVLKRFTIPKNQRREFVSEDKELASAAKFLLEKKNEPKFETVLSQYVHQMSPKPLQELQLDM